MPHALVVAQELSTLNHLQAMFVSQGYSFSITQTLAQARAEIDRRLPEIALLRPALHDGDGLVLLQDSRFANAAEVLLLSDCDREEGLVTAVRIGTHEKEARSYSQDELAEILIEVAQDIAIDVTMDMGQPPQPANGLGG